MVKKKKNECTHRTGDHCSLKDAEPEENSITLDFMKLCDDKDKPFGCPDCCMKCQFTSKQPPEGITCEQMCYRCPTDQILQKYAARHVHFNEDTEEEE